MSGQRVTVVGGGVAGLAAALAMARRGARVRVLEQAPAITEVGAGLQISPNGSVVLRALGLEAALAACGSTAAAVELREGRTGARVMRLDLGARGGAYHFLHRADLIGLLEAGARDAGVEIVTGAQMLRVVPGTPPRLEMADGTAMRADFVVGADGLRSVVRGALNTAEAAFFTRQVAWRALIAQDPDAPGAADPVAQLFMAPGRHLVSYPLRGGGLRNIAAFEERDAWAEEGWHHRGDPEAFRAAFAGIGGPVPGWLSAVRTVHVWGLFRHPVARVWHGPGCAIIGDAAHPTLPFMAQGANMALEDAWSLAAALDGGTLAAWQAVRAPRCAAIVATAGRNARLYHLSGPARAMAHAALRVGGAVAPGMALRRFDWIYGHDVTD
nr:FAD-dependent monooxygenase [Rhodobaculum claviforme]